MTLNSIHDSVANYALGALDGDDLTRFEAHLREGCAGCLASIRSYEDVLSNLAQKIDPINPPPEVRARLLMKLQTEARDKAGHHLSNTTVGPRKTVEWILAGQGCWQEFIHGVHVQALYSHPIHNYSTSLVRLDAGFSYPRHRHLDTEELYVIDGQCSIDDQEFGPGDYIRAAEGSVHEITQTVHGCTLLVIAGSRGHAFE
ncbi:MAG: cupin domain-containing protein [Acidobacteria bacterium]|nr:cupin domain-containing protein [Acidobacteriota bacterium]MBI3658747.1 cupin domain-containing protein [Acidobacteriota bacterium]